MRSFWGLPAHPFYVHLAIVALPFMTIGLLVLCLFRRRSAWWDSGFAAGFGVVLFATYLATMSGNAFAVVLDGLAPIDRHGELGNQTRWLVLALFGVSLANAAARQRMRLEGGGAERRGSLRHVSTTLLAVTVVLAVLSSIWMFRTGHEGARVTWDGVFKPKP